MRLRHRSVHARTLSSPRFETLRWDTKWLPATCFPDFNPRLPKPKQTLLVAVGCGPIGQLAGHQDGLSMYAAGEQGE